MPITASRMMELLEAADDAMEALVRASELVLDEAKRCQNGKSPADALQNLELMCQPAILMRDYARHLAIIEKEKSFYSPTRQGINRRAAAAQRRKRDGGSAK